MHLKTIPLCLYIKKKILKFPWNLSTSVQKVPQPSKPSNSVGSSFTTPRSGSTKWQTNIGLSFDSFYMKKSYRDGWKFLLRNSLVKLLVYWKQIWRWKVKHIPAVFSATSITYTLYIIHYCITYIALLIDYFIINQKKKFPSKIESILYKTN